LLLTLIAAAALAAAPPEAAPRYFFTLFGGESVPFRPRTAHTWATFAKATPAADGTTLVESVTISWLPATGVVKPFRLHAETGKNFTLQETYALAAAEGDRVSVWGPYEISAEWYARAVAQAARLESGAVRYRVLDSLGFNDRVQHCVRAVTAADMTRQFRLQPVLQVGERGTSRLAAEYASGGAFVGGIVTHDWVLPASASAAIGGDGVAGRKAAAPGGEARSGRGGEHPTCLARASRLRASRHALDPPVADLAVAGDVVFQR